MRYFNYDCNYYYYSLWLGSLPVRAELYTETEEQIEAVSGL